jgi:hypothetical protein
LSAAVDHLAMIIGRRFDAAALMKRIDDGLRVTTQCMYPSNGLVEVTLRGGTSTVVASDEGGAMGEALAAGIPMRHFGAQISNLVRDQGLLFGDGVIYTAPIPIEAAPLAVLLVANASQDAARWLYDHVKIKRSRDFRELLATYLKKAFDDRVAPATIVGHSRKSHKFANVISFPSGNRLIVDGVTNEPSSVSARVLANLDVKANEDPRIIQRIVYDDDEVWTAADLNLLQIGADVISFSHSSEVIERLASHA